MKDTGTRLIYVFDFDGTLTKRDSFILFAKHALGLKRLILGLLKSSPWLAGWKLGISCNSTAKERLFRYLYKGMPLSVFEEAAKSFIGVLNDNVGKAIEPFISAIEKNATVYILSASIENWIIPWAQAHGIPREKVISTKMAVDSSGRITGSFSSPNCHGKEKIRRFLEIEPARATYYLIAYADSKSDIPFLALADEPHLI